MNSLPGSKQRVVNIAVCQMGDDSIVIIIKIYTIFMKLFIKIYFMNIYQKTLFGRYQNKQKILYFNGLISKRWNYGISLTSLMNILQNQLKIITAYTPDNMRKYEKILRKKALSLIFKEGYLVSFFQNPLVTEGNIFNKKSRNSSFYSTWEFFLFIHSTWLEMYWPISRDIGIFNSKILSLPREYWWYFWNKTWM